MKKGRDARFLAMNTALKALADPTRVRILGLLAAGDVCVCNIHEALGIPQPTASRHLAYLRRAGLVDTRREGLWVHYRVAHAQDAVVRTLLASFAHCLGHVDTIAGDRKRLESATGCCAVTSKRPALACCADVRRG